MNQKKEKSQSRENVRIAVKLHDADLITREQLQEIVKNILVWEITTSLEKKIERKSHKLTTLKGKL